MGTDGTSRDSENQAAPEIVAVFAESGHGWKSRGRVFRLRRALRLFDRGKAAVEEGPGAAECRVVFRSGFGVGGRQFSGDSQEYGDPSVRPAKGLIHRCVRS